MTEADAAQRWRDGLASWGIPKAILDQAPESPWIHPVSVFTVTDQPAPDNLSHATAREAVPPGGTLLDVGCGGGRATFAVAPPAASVIGVDHQAGMLEAFAAAAAARGLEHTEVLGDWPEVAGSTPAADVVVCHHVFFNVADLAPFALALSERARRRVVVEIPFRHPLAHMSAFWKRFWDLERPDGPTAEDAAQVLRDVGLPVNLQAWDDAEPARETTLAVAERVRFLRIRLCLPAGRDPEVAQALAELGPAGPRRTATLWWDVA